MAAISKYRESMLQLQALETLAYSSGVPIGPRTTGRNSQQMRTFLKFSVFAICISSSAFRIAETLYYDNAVYVGEVVNGNSHGQGTTEFTNGYKYEGGWILETRRGQGTQIFADGRIWFRDGRGVEEGFSNLGANFGTFLI
jgi:hypothetical protein